MANWLGAFGFGFVLVALGGGALSFIPLVTLVLGPVAAVQSFPRGDVAARKRTIWTIALVVPPTIVLFGSLFALNRPPPAWVGELSYAALVIGLGLVVLLVAILKGVRYFATLTGVVSLALTWLLSLVVGFMLQPQF